MTYCLSASWTTGGVPQQPINECQRPNETVAQFEARFDTDVADSQALHPPDPPA